MARVREGVGPVGDGGLGRGAGDAGGGAAGEGAEAGPGGEAGREEEGGQSGRMRSVKGGVGGCGGGGESDSLTETERERGSGARQEQQDGLISKARAMNRENSRLLSDADAWFYEDARSAPQDIQRYGTNGR